MYTRTVFPPYVASPEMEEMYHIPMPPARYLQNARFQSMKAYLVPLVCLYNPVRQVDPAVQFIPQELRADIHSSGSLCDVLTPQIVRDTVRY